MCISKVGRVVSVSVSGDGATVEFPDGRRGGVDISVVHVRKGQHVEVFGGVALSVLTPTEARRRRAAWNEVLAAGIGSGEKL